ncbi:TraR/DksA family transcriptional regulator [Thioalkalivibrio sp. ALE21]|uniref:TraR/DksA family transcriptional regulator n=1 Tax=Thioalkalivibrio sp. ALE21 TaxID=1158175 RepID=UPI000D9E041D|nr:TraR/DksA C4-type zinc finger protein [Thioalkalivibrio sp. ALE21]PYG00423.1 TraR/DksA family transcriptional regulator [Thioalkalivibrio sp. ALE21]
MSDETEPVPEDWLRERLEALLVDLDTALDEGREGGATVELDQQRTGRLSRMDALQAQAMARASQQRRENQRRRAQRALERLKEGEGGLCVDCLEPIARSRLEIDPAVERCIACAEARESGG